MTRPAHDSPLSLEQAVLIACARRELLPTHRQQLAAVLPRVDWDVLWPLARLHGVQDFVVGHLRQLGPGACTSQEDRVRAQQRQTGVQAALLLEQQMRLDDAFARAGIAVLWLKGLALSEQLYGRVEARQCVDLDLLTEAAAVPRVEAALARDGFVRHHAREPGEDEHPMSAHHRAWSREVVPGWPLSVEVHHRLPGPAACQPAAADLLRRSRTVPLRGRPVRVPGPEDGLTILCLHAHHHNFGILRTLMDVAEYVKVYHRQLDWTAFRELARADRVRGRVDAALALAGATLGFDPAPGRLPFESDLSPLQRWAVRRLTSAAVLDTAGEQDDFRRARLALLMDRPADVVRLLGPHLIPPAAYVAALCPPAWSRWPGYARFYHLARLAHRLARAARG